MGPRRGKSELASRRLPAFALGLHPDWEIIATSWGGDLATDMSRDTKRIILSPEYHELFPRTNLNPRHVVADDRQASVNTADRWDVLGHKGKYTGKGIGGGITGKGFTLGIIDDPFKDDEQAQSEPYRAKVWNWYRKVFWTRRSPDARIVIMHTRWHENDLVGRLLHEAKTRKTADQWTVVNLREIREDEENAADPRAPGEVLWPARYPLAEAEELREADPATFAALYQQRPAPAEGYLCKLDWLQKRYTVLPAGAGQWRISWDLRNGGRGKKTSQAVGLLWFRPFATPGQIYLVDRIAGRWEYPEEELQFRAFCEKNPQALEKLVENKADGRVLIPRLQSIISGIVPYEPGVADKAARFRVVLPLFKAGNVWLPDESICPTIREYIDSLMSFPVGSTDDDVDATSQALSDWATEGRPTADVWW